ncbi:hypothetical protein SPBR_07418 [Sporothrix brasiliensis 5110]|uniref:Uncharacterized protein n=1 Tax=Sporothrix brasiliensis 5110 TaxID=1398154 RepID=A0A0C2IJS5_9PEZI|nr:uncharacterized protein SPBR_07418 [Sporothrix brasiliensis 5110]KIH89416.1 hypothetical protein SPBR_07418 [Sporothrix brasiliensis 5110]
MAPVRRYLRISKYSVLECRIYVDNPALVQSWLLHPRDPVLPRVIESVRPLVLPKLMEERERAKKKGTKKKGAIRDVLVEGMQWRAVTSKIHTLTGGTSDAPIDVEDGGNGDLRVELDQDGNFENGDGDEDVVLTAASVGGTRQQPDRETPPNLLLEDSDDEVPFALQDIPDIQEDKEGGVDTADATTRRPKRQRQDPVQVRDSGDDEDGANNREGAESDNDSLFVSDNENNDDHEAPPSKRSRVVPVDADNEDEASRKKKKLAMDVIYEGFAIYGRVLCLVVKRRGPPRGRGAQTLLPASVGGSRPGNTSTSLEPTKPGGQAAMENWIASTQMPIPQASETGMS